MIPLRARTTRAATVAGCLLAVWSCDGGPPTGPGGEVRGLVQVEGESVPGVVVELTGQQIRTVSTDATGRYSFSDVPNGAYVVSIRNIPGDASFPATSRPAVLRGAQVVDVDFLGDYIRTASIEGTVTSGTQGIPGVTVTLTGAEPESSIVTSADGSFLFAGLRAGSYQVEISDVPVTVTFPSVRTDVDVAIGQRAQVGFTGVPELTASVVIRSIERRTPSGALELADPQNLNGQLEVTLTVDGGEDTLSRVELLLGGEIVAAQEFDPGSGSPSTADGPATAAPFDVVFSVNTAEFDLETGAVRFENGQDLLTARLATVEGGPAAWLASVQVQLRNPNTFAGTVTPQAGPVLGMDGESWIGGGLDVSVVPVLFDPSRTVASATLDLRREGGGQLRVVTASGGGPFAFSLPATGAPSSQNLVGYQTPRGARDQVRIVSALYSDGGSVPGVPAVIAQGLHIDNVAPPAVSFALPTQGADAECCRTNWVGSSFRFADAVTAGEDEGVGGLGVTTHVGPANSTDAELAEVPGVLEGRDLDATVANTELRAVAVVSDDLGNAVVAPLEPTPDNSIVNALGAVFGVDLALPRLAFGEAGVSDRAINPAPGGAWVLEPTDATSGVHPSGARTTVTLDNTVVRDTPDACLFPATDECDPTPDGFVRPVPDGIEGYVRIRTRALDRGGNGSEVLTRELLRDTTPPTVASVTAPDGFAPGGTTDLSAILADNLDLVEGWVSLEFSDGVGTLRAAPFDVPETVGVAFDEELSVGASVSQSFPLVTGLETVAPGAEGDEPSGTPLVLTAVRGVAVDAARQVGVLSRPVTPVPGPTLTSFAVSARGESGGIVDWSVAAGSGTVCREDPPGSTEGCGEAVPVSVELTATARGRTGVLTRPFERVYFYRVLGGEYRLIGVTAAAEMADGPGVQDRTWTWSFIWMPVNGTPRGPVEILAIGADEQGNALETNRLGSLTVDGG